MAECPTSIIPPGSTAPPASQSTRQPIAKRVSNIKKRKRNLFAPSRTEKIAPGIRGPASAVVPPKEPSNTTSFKSKGNPYGIKGSQSINKGLHLIGQSQGPMSAAAPIRREG